MKELPATIGPFQFDTTTRRHFGWYSVVAGIDRRMSRRVVFQVFHVSESEAAVRDTILSQATTLSSHRSDHVARVLDVAWDAEHLALAFDVDDHAGTLASFVLRSTPDVGARVRVVTELVEAAVVAGKAGVHNLILVPSVVRMTADGHVKALGVLPRLSMIPGANDEVSFYTPADRTSGGPADERGQVHALLAVLIHLLLLDGAPLPLCDSGDIDLAVVRPKLRNLFNLGSLAETVLTPPSKATVTLEDVQAELARYAVLALARDSDAALFDSMASTPEIDGSPTAEIVFDDNVQFTVYRPKLLVPGRWHALLAFAHLAELPSGSAPDEPDPLAEVTRQARGLLDDLSDYRQAIEDAAQRIPREGELTFVPTVPGADVNPASHSFRWTEPVHREEFRIRARPDVGSQNLRGRMSVYLGAVLVAEINLTFALSARAVERLDPGFEQSSRRPYRRIFASYSHRDAAVVEQCRRYAKAMGDEYMQDVINLRSGERWAPALEKLISAADVFQLFWSWHALESRYVQEEWRYALALNRPSFVRPVYWEEPLPTRDDLPPQELIALHFERMPVGSHTAPRLSEDTGALPLPQGPPTRASEPVTAGQVDVSVDSTLRDDGDVAALRPRRRDAGASPADISAEAASSRGARVTAAASRRASGSSEPPKSRLLSVRTLSMIAGAFLAAVIVPMIYFSMQRRSPDAVSTSSGSSSSASTGVPSATTPPLVAPQVTLPPVVTPPVVAPAVAIPPVVTPPVVAPSASSQAPARPSDEEAVRSVMAAYAGRTVVSTRPRCSGSSRPPMPSPSSAASRRSSPTVCICGTSS